MKDLTGKTAVITGASRGIGAATATAFAAAGANICLLARSETQIIELAKDIGPRAMARACGGSGHSTRTTSVCQGPGEYLPEFFDP